MGKNHQMPQTSNTLVDKIPQHVAIIMDGNGRWAKERNQPRVYGHQNGINSVRAIVEAAVKKGVKYLTLYSFSEENWGRPKQEVDALMELINIYIVEERKLLHKNNVAIHTIGNIKRLPEKTQALIQETKEMLQGNSGLNLVLALSYGARDELVRAAKDIATAVKNDDLKLEDITEETISRHMDTRNFTDPDLLIRTSGEIRISNFLLWQMAYTEFYFSETYWPDFREEHFNEALKVYANRQRRFGLL